MAVALALRLRHILVAGAYDEVDRLYLAGAVGKGGNRRRQSANRRPGEGCLRGAKLLERSPQGRGLGTEEKAAHLLYFVVKNHVFVDGNKRSGAYAFVWFLQKTGLLNLHEISPQALTALTLLVAESKPEDKDKMIGLVLLMLKVDNGR